MAHGEMKNLTVDAQPTPEPSTPFTDAAGKSHTLAEFKGKAVVVNLWATWCAPCVEEMPTLAKLETATQGQPVVILPVSVDRDEDRANAETFLAKSPPLPFYNTQQLALAYAFNPPVADMPTTLLIDASGRVRARVTGGADWSSPDARKVVEAIEKAS